MLPEMPDSTVRMLRVPQPSELPTSEIPRYEDGGEIMEPIEQHDEYDEDHWIEGKPGSFKNRQIQYMTAAIVWALVLAVLLVFGTVVWKLCLVIAS